MKITLNVNVGQDVDEVVAYAAKLSAALTAASVTVKVQIDKSSPPSKRIPDALENVYLEVSGKNHMRRTENRTYEEMAEYNLRTYHGYTDADIQILQNGGAVIKNVSTDDESITVEDAGDVVFIDSDDESVPDTAKKGKAGF